MSIKLDMTSPNIDNYKYFETISHGSPGHDTGTIHNSNIDHLQLTQLPDPSLRSSPFWRILPHIWGFVFLYAFTALYFNNNIWIFYPLIFFDFIVILLFIILYQKDVFERACVPGLFNNLSWAMWSFIALWICISMIQESLTLGFNAHSNPNTDGIHEFPKQKKQIEIVITCVFLTALMEQILHALLCHRAFERYFVNGAGFASINSLILYCAVIGIGVGVAKSIISLSLLGHSTVKDLHQGFIIDYKYGLLDYIVIPFIANHANDNEHEWVFVLVSSLVYVTYHASIGCLWGIGYVRRCVLEHTLAFSQILMFPWFAQMCVNLILTEIFYNQLDYDFANKREIYLSAGIATPAFFTIFNFGVCFVLFRRTIAPSMSQTQIQQSYDMAM